MPASVRVRYPSFPSVDGATDDAALTVAWDASSFQIVGGKYQRLEVAEDTEKVRPSFLDSSLKIHVAARWPLDHNSLEVAVAEEVR